METVRGILAAHPGGISRAGILAWAQLRIDPDFDATRLEAELAALGGDVVERDGFLWLTSSAGAPEAAQPLSMPEAGPSAPDVWPVPASMAPVPSWSTRTGIPERETGGQGEPGEDEGSGGVDGAPWGERTVLDRGPAADGGAATGGGPGTGWRGTPEAQTGPTQGWTRSSSIVGSWASKIVALAIAAGFLIANLIGFLGSGEESESTPVPTGPRSSMLGSMGPVEDISVGDCLGLPTGGEFSEVLFVPCASPHDAEVFFVGDHPGTDEAYPDEAAFEAWVDDTCPPAFEAYTGSALDGQSVLDIGWFTPTESSWSAGDRVVQCYLAPADGSPTSVSWRGANP